MGRFPALYSKVLLARSWASRRHSGPLQHALTAAAKQRREGRPVGDDELTTAQNCSLLMGKSATSASCNSHPLDFALGYLTRCAAVAFPGVPGCFASERRPRVEHPLSDSVPIYEG